MKAMVITEFGGTDVFKESEVQKPQPGPGQLLVRVYATSVNPVDYKIRQAGEWAGIKPPVIIGYDVSGVVEAVGDGVTDFKVGDEVYYTPEIFGRQGTYAPYHVVEEAIVALKPKNITHTEAASLPLAGGTAYDALITRAQLKVGERVLIHGGTGGVGSLAIQIAKASGAYVYTTCSKNQELARGLGADRIIDYKAQNFVDVVNKETNGAGVDVVFDTVGEALLSQSIQVTRPHGRMVGIVESLKGDFSGALFKNLTLHCLFLERARYKLDALRVLVERGLVKPVVDSVLPLEKVAEAHQKLEQGGVGGKIVLNVEK